MAEVEKIKNIAVIGGTGMTGQCVVDYALEKGFYKNRKSPIY